MNLFRRKPDRRRIALVGNAPLAGDLSAVIDSCDIVVRCNEAKNFGGHSGTRTDILCITNTGAPAVRITTKRSIRRAERFPALREIWFPRDPGFHLDHLRASGLDTPESEFVDHSEALIAANRLDGMTVTRFSRAFNVQTFARLQEVSRTPFVCPSTGFMALWYVLQRTEYADWDKYLLGFTFDMWSGHPAAAERALTRALCKDRRDIRWIAGRFGRWKTQVRSLLG